MTSWLQTTRHYLSRCWPRSLSPYGATRQWVIYSPIFYSNTHIHTQIISIFVDLIFMSLIVLYFLPSISVLLFYIDVILTLSILMDCLYVILERCWMILFTLILERCNFYQKHASVRCYWALQCPWSLVRQYEKHNREMRMPRRWRHSAS